MLALFAAWEAWSYVTDKQNETLERTKTLLEQTREELVKIGEQKQLDKMAEAFDLLAKAREKLERMKAGQGENIALFGDVEVVNPFGENYTKQEVFEQELLIKKLQNKIEVINNISDIENKNEQKLKLLREKSTSLDQQRLNLTRDIAESRGEEKDTLEKELVVLDKQRAEVFTTISSLEKQQAELSGVSRQYKQVASDAEAVAEATAKAATAALQLKQSLLQGQLTRREISEESFIEQKLDLQLRTADQISDLDEQYRAEVKAFDDYETSMFQLRLKQKEDLYNSEFSLLERNGTQAEKIAKKRQLLELQGLDAVVLENRLREYALGLAEKEAKAQNKKSSSLREEQEILGKIKSEKKKIEDLDKALSIRNSTDFKDIFLPSFVLAKKKYETAKLNTVEVEKGAKGDQGRLNVLKAIRKEKEAELKLQQSINESIEAYGSFIVDITSGFKEGKGLNEALSNIGPQIASTMQQSENVYVKSAGYALQILGNLFSSSVSEAQIKAATGRSEWDDE